MNSKIQKPATPWPLIVLFFILSASATVTGIIYYKSLQKHLLGDTLEQLSAIADLKVRQIIQWRQERLSDGGFLRSNSPHVRQFSQFLTEQNNRVLKNDLLRSLKSYTENYDYKNALFADSNFNVRLFYPEKDTVIGEHLQSILPVIMSSGEVIVTDIHQTGKVSYAHLDLLVPLKGPEHNDSTVFGILILRIDPEKILFPILQTWPSSSKTAEALLVYTESDDVVYLNKLRHEDNTEMSFRKPIIDDKLPAAMAVQGIMGTSDATDYRGIRVVAAMKKIPGTTWYLVAKIDREEVYESLNDSIGQVVIIIILFILMSGFFLGFLWWNQRVRFYRGKYEAELEHMALVKHFDYILKHANDIILLVDKDFVIVEANDKAIETYQYERSELIGKNVNQLRSLDIPESNRHDYKILGDSGHLTYETIHKRKDGTIFSIEISARKVDIEGVPYYQSIGRDITERKRTEEILRDSEDRFRKIFEESPFSMVMAGKDMGIIKTNSAFCSMLGYTEEEIIGMTFRNFTHPDHISNDDVSMLRLVARDIPVYHTEKRYIRSDGTVIWGSTTVTLIRNNKGEFQFSLAMVEDITARKTARAELDKSFSIIKATLESTADGILVVDTEGKIVQYNHKFAEMWHIPQEVLRLNEDDAAISFVLDQLKNPEAFITKVRQLYSDREAVSHDLIEFRDGRVFDRYSQPQKIGGKAVGRVWSFRDITERKKAEADLIAAKEKAEESDRLKTAFLHNVSHEIRTPMNAILGFSSLLNEPDITENDRKQFVDVIFQSGNQLLSIINDIVDLAGIESGQVKLNIREVYLNRELRKLSEQFSYKQKLLNITLSLKTPLPDRDARILTDSTKLVQILSNMINNAFKFTRKGKISFGYTRKDDFLEFFVKDTGEGIPTEHQSKVFDRFYQVDSAASRQYSGTGLGLSICKAYIELLGGRIWLSSVPGEGSVFYFTIPYKKKEG